MKLSIEAAMKTEPPSGLHRTVEAAPGLAISVEARMPAMQAMQSKPR
jgi:hypothetical protein